MTTRLITTTDGCKLSTQAEGAPARPFVVLSSSLGTDTTMWWPQVDALGAQFRVVRYDPRGHGHSEVPEHPLTIERLGRDVLDVMDAYRIDRASFCGLSMGGMVGQWLGAHAPERIERLVLANTAPSMGPPSRWQERIDRVLREGMGAIADDVVERWFTPSFRERAPAAVAQMRAKLLAMPPAGYAGCCAAIRDLDLRESAGRISVPTLLIAGDSDPATPPERAYEIARAMQRTPEVVTLAAAHMSNVEQPDAFNRALLGFLS